MNYILERLQEPSTWAGMAGVLAPMGLTLPPGVIQNVSLVGAGLAGLIAVFVKERGT